MKRLSVERKYRPSVGTILLAYSLIILLLPLGSLLFFRAFEDMLVKETEGELIVQAAVLDANLRQTMRRQLPDHAVYGVPVEPAKVETGQTGRYLPIKPQIDLTSHAVLPPRPDPVATSVAPDAVLLEIGQEMINAFTEAQRVTLAGLRLLDHRGTIIGGRDDVGTSLAHVREVREALAGRHTSVLRRRISDSPTPPLTSISRGTGVRIFLAYPVIEGDRLWGVIYLSRTPSNIFRSMYAARYRLIVIGGLVLALTVFLAWLTSRTLLRPIRSLSQQAQQFARTRDVRIEPLPGYGTKEIATLGQSFLDMASALNRHSAYVNNFATHVSHEFKTPLTAIRGATELLREHNDEMNEAERERFLDNIQADAARLKTLVDRLNELGRADTTSPFCETIDIAAAIEALASDNKDVTAQIRVERPCQLQISHESFGIIADNLIQNARQAGATHIGIDVVRAEDRIEIRFHDDGHGISPGHRDQIFEPFFTTRRETNGTGLGLRIVRSLAEAHAGAVSYRPTDRGTCLVVALSA